MHLIGIFIKLVLLDARYHKHKIVVFTLNATFQSNSEPLIHIQTFIRGRFNKQVTNRDLKETNGDNDIQTAFIFQCNLHTNLNTCPTVSQVPGNLRRKILLVAAGTTRALLFQPHHRQESVPPKDLVLEDCLT